jgi:ABC-type branched-subunit amino acid transport system substrate-binding protein
MKSLFGTYAYTYASFEGYIAAQTVAAGLQDAISNLGYNNITSKNFIDALYDTQEYYISGEKIGPYYKNCITNTSCGCNQGLRKIWPTFVRPNITFQLITEAIYSWSGACIADTTSIPIPLVFGQSAALTGAAAYTGNSMRAGILAAFLEYNNAGGYNGRSVQLESM